eukprot:1157141-Pelagomonas_calceolata.AAC.1
MALMPPNLLSVKLCSRIDGCHCGCRRRVCQCPRAALPVGVCEGICAICDWYRNTQPVMEDVR